MMTDVVQCTYTYAPSVGVCQGNGDDMILLDILGCVIVLMVILYVINGVVSWIKDRIDGMPMTYDDGDMMR